MHRCLKIDELLSTIAEFLDDPQSIVAMALTCKAFHEPAMDAKWREVRGFKHLLPLLPRECAAKILVCDTRRLCAWLSPSCSYRPQAPSTECAATADDWTRFDYYARRIRTLHWTTRPLTLVSAVGGLLDAMHKGYGDRPAFPNLRNFYCHSVSPAWRPEHWSLFVQPRLRSLSVSECCWIPLERRVDRLKLLQQVRSAAPSLQELIIDLVEVDQDTIEVMAKMQHLRKLILQTHFSPMSRESNVSGAMFPALQHLEISVLDGDTFNVPVVDGCSAASSLLRIISSRSIKIMSISYNGVGINETSLRALLHAVAKFSSSLATCSLQIDGSSWEELHPTASFSALLQPLLALGSSLIDLDLTAFPLDILTHDLYALLRACSNLLSLELSQTVPSGTTRSNLTLSALKVARELCPRLEYLSLPIADTSVVPQDEEDVPSDEDLKIAPPSTHALKTFMFGYMEDSVSPANAAILFAKKCFPEAKIYR